MTSTIYFDGACEYWQGNRNPGGIATYGWYIEKDNQRLAWGYGEAGRGGSISNNVAEYTALIEALKAAIALNIQGDLTIQGDSQLVINQVTGLWGCNKPHLARLCNEAEQLVRTLPGQKTICWIPREQNEQADILSKAAYKKSLQLGSQWMERYKAPALEGVTVR